MGMEVPTREAFDAVVVSTLHLCPTLGHTLESLNTTELCNGGVNVGVNTFLFGGVNTLVSGPAMYTYQFDTPQGYQARRYCTYPTPPTSPHLSDCDQQFTSPPAARFCSCSCGDPVQTIFA